jgi:sterol desaturase/sphingolipid hydroxylase (fatty acid hydroxylase superfamily)
MPISPIVLIDPHLRGLPMLVGPLCLIAAEYGISLLARRNAYDLRETAATLGIAAGRILLRGMGALFIAAPALFVWQHHLFTFNQTSPIALAFLFLASECIYYWHHRLSHRLRWLWATHIVHHSTTRLNLSSAVRLGVTGSLSGNRLFFMPLVLIGFHPFLVTAVVGLNLLYQFFIHTELVPRLGPLEWIFNTPGHHRVHHAINAECIDRNFGGILIIFDRLFGTFAREPKNEELRYGVLNAAPNFNPFRIVFGEWIAIARDVWAAPDTRLKFKALVQMPHVGPPAAPSPALVTCPPSTQHPGD